MLCKKTILKSDFIDFGCIVKKTTLDGKLISTTSFSNKDEKSKHGVQLFFYENGKILSSAIYVNGSLNGNLMAYYEDVKLSREEIYENDKLIEGNCFDNSGKVIAFNSYYAKAIPCTNWWYIISDNLKYPKDAKKRNISGRILLSFIVEKDGSITEIKIKNSVYRSIDLKAIRVVKLLDKFTPVFRNGKPVRSYFSLPITFSLK